MTLKGGEGGVEMEEMTRLETINRQIKLKKESIEMIIANLEQSIDRINGEINLLELEISEIESKPESTTTQPGS